MNKLFFSFAVLVLSSSFAFGQLYSSGNNTISGNRVGVATNTPDGLFQVGSGLSKFAVGPCGGAQTQYGTSYAGFNVSRNGSSSWKVATDGYSNGGAMLYGTAGGNLNFVTFSNTANGQDQSFTDASMLSNIRLRITHDGNVGIGLASANPTERLHVMGNSTLEGYEPFLRLQNQWQNSAPGNVTSLRFNNGSQDVWKINAQVSGAEEFSITRRDWNNASNDIKVLSIKHNEGIVGIGTDNLPVATTQNGGLFRLYVKGGIKTEEVKVELCGGSWCDYVFEDDYELMPLSKVEKHIEEKGHLHNIQSAAEIEENGFGLKEMTINQQEKIEEVFLHLIEMEKQLNQLKDQNASLNSKVEKLEQENTNLKATLSNNKQ